MILFTAEWCVPCKNLKEWLKDKSFDIQYLDVDENSEKRLELGVRSIPTLIHNNEIYIGNEQIRPYLEGLDANSN